MVKVAMMFDSCFWPDEEFIVTATRNPTGFPISFVNLHKIHGVPGLLAMLSGAGAEKADAMTEEELVPQSKKDFEYARNGVSLEIACSLHFT